MQQQTPTVIPPGISLTLEIQEALECQLSQERPRLVRFCAHLTDTPSVAEDLAQETLLEAWRHLHKLALPQQPDGVHKWLLAIARNVCMRWSRARHRDLAQTTSFTRYAAEEGKSEDLVDDSFDMEIELERDELTRLLDQALRLLSPVTRTVLIERYIHESPHADIAERLGLSEDALEQRLYRGKLALRRVLLSDLVAETASFGLLRPSSDQDHEAPTHIWCPMCNQAQLQQYSDMTSDRVGFRCHSCWHIASQRDHTLWAGLRNPKAILNRQIEALWKHYHRAIYSSHPTCHICQSPARMQIVQPELFPAEIAAQLLHLPSIHIACTRCTYEELNSLAHLTLDVPKTSQFWRKHPRMRWLPAHQIEHGGVPTLVSSFQSADSSARLDILFERATLKVLDMYEA